MTLWNSYKNEPQKAQRLTKGWAIISYVPLLWFLFLPAGIEIVLNMSAYLIDHEWFSLSIYWEKWQDKLKVHSPSELLGSFAPWIPIQRTTNFTHNKLFILSSTLTGTLLLKCIKCQPYLSRTYRSVYISLSGGCKGCLLSTLEIRL